MLKNYFKIAFRHLIRSKSSSLINVLGLAVGITAFFLIAQYISFELSYDKFHTNHESIYRIAIERPLANDHAGSIKSFNGLRRLLHDNFPEVENSTGFYKIPANTGFLFSYKGKIFNEGGGVLQTDSSFFKVFSSLLLIGNPATVLNDAKNIVLSEKMARKIFRDEDPIGKHLDRMDDKSNEEADHYIVTGILRDIPENSHLHAEFIIKDGVAAWNKSYVTTYLTLAPGTNTEKIANRINKLLEPLGEQYTNIKGSLAVLQPLAAIHLSSHYPDEFESNGSKNLLYSLGTIGLIILVMAWINYVNLESARFLLRLKEVGVRRIIGSSKSHLGMQFLVEYFCLTMFATILAFVLTGVILPSFGTISGINLNNLQWATPAVGWIAIGIFLTGSLIAGIFPTWFLLRINPMISLKGSGGRQRNGFFRQSLVTIQFTASFVLIAFVLIIHQQLNLMRIDNKKIELEQVIALRNPTAYGSDEPMQKYQAYHTFENKLAQSPSVKLMTGSSAIPGAEIGFTYVNLLKRNKDDAYDPTIYKTLFTGYNYLQVYGIKLLAGRNFERPGRVWSEPWKDKGWHNLILNETAIHQLGFKSPAEAVNQEVYFEAFWDGLEKCTIIGVVEDYHHEAVKKAVFPTILYNNYDSFQQVYYSIRLNAGTQPKEAIADIQKSWQEIFPDSPFEYFFLDDYYDRQFKSELQFETIFTSFATVAIFIACLGILGMTLFEANTRLKEISIRKVLGATSASLVALLSKDHIRVVIISFLIAVPVIYYFAKEWLIGYPIRIEISAYYFIVPFTMMLVVVAITSSFQTIKAANTNLLNHLKND